MCLIIYHYYQFPSTVAVNHAINSASMYTADAHSLTDNSIVLCNIINSWYICLVCVFVAGVVALYMWYISN